MLSLLVIGSNGITTTISEIDTPRKCTLERSYKKVGYNCAALNLRTVPQHLKSNVEVSRV